MLLSLETKVVCVCMLKGGEMPWALCNFEPKLPEAITGYWSEGTAWEEQRTWLVGDSLTCSGWMSGFGKGCWHTKVQNRFLLMLSLCICMFCSSLSSLESTAWQTILYISLSRGQLLSNFKSYSFGKSDVSSPGAYQHRAELVINCDTALVTER